MSSSPASPLTPNSKTQYYVIIGCGFSGILNHVLLRQLGTRLGGRDILHIGKPDPWRNYHPMPMGQWPTLLTLPGFTNKPPALNRYTNLYSDEFARVNQFEWDRLANAAYPFYHVAGDAVAIRASTMYPGGYDVDLDDRKTFQADYIDVCGGPGPARTIPPPPSMWVDPTLEDEFNGSPVAPGRWPRLVSGEDFLTAKTPPVPDGQHVCVYGGGATGAWCVERAQMLGHTVHWVADKELNDAFVASRRNDDLLQRPVVRKIVGDVQVVTSRLRPASPNTFFGENMVANQITPTAAGDVEISFSPAASATWRLTARTGPVPLGPTVLTLPAQQVVLSIGQETSYTESRSWARLLRPVLDGPPRKKNRLIKDRQRRVVGLRSEDGHIRVLGAAALSHPDVSEKWKKPGSPSNVFFRSLVEQARVPNGITLSAISVAEANDFWSKIAPNDNLNTCGIKDLKRLTQKWPAGFYGGETWFAMRGHRIPPFEIVEFQNMATGKVSY